MKRLTILGVELDPLTIEELNACISAAIERRERWIIANHNLRSLYLFYRDPRMRAFFARASIIHIDGMPLVYWARLLGYPVRKAHRVTYVDWVHPLMATAEAEGWRIFYLGASPAWLLGRPGSCRNVIRGCSSGPITLFHPGRKRNRAAGDCRISAARADGRHGHAAAGTLVLDNLDRIQANAILTAGACFDYIAGAIPTPPRWMGRMGLEWLYRLFSEPRRLWRRYLVEPWALLPLFLKDLLNIREHRRRAQRLASNTTRRVTAESVSEKLS